MEETDWADLDDIFADWDGGLATFTCPRCSKELYVSDAVIEKVQTDSKYKGFEIHGRMVHHKYLDTYYYVRYCPECARKRNRNSCIGAVCFVGVLPIIISSFIAKSVGHFFGCLLGLMFICFILYGWAYWFKLKFGANIDLEHAAKCNALSSMAEYLSQSDRKDWEY